MDIHIESLIEGAARASGAEALALRERGIEQICMGEVGGRPIEGFDFGNSPYELSKVDLSGVAIIQRTSAGTQGITTAARAAQHMFAASLVTASATAQALRLIANDRITLVAMGENGKRRSSEDEICALYLRNLLEGRRGNPEAARQMILSGGEVVKFNDVNRPWLIPDDVPFALDIDRYDFAIKVAIEDGYPVARKFEA